ncbi:helix-turn-helix domain-containing protein [Streptomyces sp. NPDC000927]|uniref:helix-turn-helix domain-containing protein n=1 Tax=Streptomyces sp. NPDC000927 TaxID=3154371 RepID=UPI00332B0539
MQGFTCGLEEGCQWNEEQRERQYRRERQQDSGEDHGVLFSGWWRHRVGGGGRGLPTVRSYPPCLLSVFLSDSLLCQCGLPTQVIQKGNSDEDEAVRAGHPGGGRLDPVARWRRERAEAPDIPLTPTGATVTTSTSSRTAVPTGSTSPTLLSICSALDCQPGDILKLEPRDTRPRKG